MDLLLDPLAKSLLQLEKSLGYAASPLARSEAELEAQFRAAAIQHFEIAYELCVKLLFRAMRQRPGGPPPTFKAMIREAAQVGWVDDPAAWFAYLDFRNQTVHTYDEARAETVLAALPAFLASARHTLRALARDFA